MSRTVPPKSKWLDVIDQTIDGGIWHTYQLLASCCLLSQLLDTYGLLIALYYQIEQAQIQGYADRSILPRLRHESNLEKSPERIHHKLNDFLLDSRFDG